jgi:hypothetical protein
MKEKEKIMKEFIDNISIREKEMDSLTLDY